jgi:hypothetical protein
MADVPDILPESPLIAPKTEPYRIPPRTGGNCCINLNRPVECIGVIERV